MYWINPLAWAFRSAVLNEFQSPEYESECVVFDDGDSCVQNLGQVKFTVSGLVFLRCSLELQT